MGIEGPVGNGDLLRHLRELELTLQRLDVRRDRARLNELIHESFVEFGRSGRPYHKADILQQLPRETAPDEMWSQDFELLEVAADAALLTYRSASIDAGGGLFRYSLRSSLWQRTTAGWQLRFHQGTATKAFVKSIN